MKRLLSILLWSVIAAAFIGPGTVTTAASAGASHGLALLWALAFSTLACLVLQEAAARLPLVSGHDLGEALRRQYPGGVRGTAVLLVVLGAVILGCAAYEAGNILGGVEGAVLAVGLGRGWLTLASGALAAALLWSGSPRTVARLLSLLVAVMGAGFLATAVALRPPLAELLAGTLLPTLPPGSAVLALGLVGTTVVPYNLFLGSGLARGQTLGEMRLGLAVAVLAGGLISAAVLVVGSAVGDPFSFPALAAVLEQRLGAWAGGLVAVGLLAAGLSSAVTAPLAAAITARSLFGSDDGRWGERSWRYRAVWGAVLATGVGFGLSGVRPVPAIILAQAFNGVLLPLAAAFLFVAVNDRRIVGRAGLNGGVSNAAMALVLLVGMTLGARNLLAVAAALGAAPLEGAALVGWSAAAAVVATLPVLAAARRRRALG